MSYDNTYHIFIPSYGVATAISVRETAYPVSRAWVCRWCGTTFAQVVAFSGATGGNKEAFTQLTLGDCPDCGIHRTGLGATGILESLHWRYALRNLPESWMRYEIDCAIDSVRGQRKWEYKLKEQQEHDIKHSDWAQHLQATHDSNWREAKEYKEFNDEQHDNGNDSDSDS